VGWCSGWRARSDGVVDCFVGFCVWYGWEDLWCAYFGVVEGYFYVLVDFALYILLFVGFGFGEYLDCDGVVGDLFDFCYGGFGDYYW